MWITDESGGKLFAGGRENWSAAAAVADACQNFSADDDDEQCAEELLSCYNCRYRRWTPESFTCLAAVN